MFKGFFNRMYNGNPNRPDLDPDDMPKNRFELFFTTLGIRIGDLIKLNLLFVVFLLPLLVWTGLSFLALNSYSTGDAAEMTEVMISILMSYFMINILVLPLAGPPLAGMTYIVRNYARDEHAWLWSDFKEQMKTNWKQSMGAMLLLAVILYVSGITLQVYAVSMGARNVLHLGFASMQLPVAAQGSNSWFWVMELLFVVFVAFFMLSYIYVLPMLVTYKLKIKQIIRNSLMLALGRLPFTLIFGFMAVFPFVLAFLIVSSFGLAEGSPVLNYTLLGLVIYYLLIGFAFTSFILNSYTNATFDRLMKPEDDGGRRVKPVDPEDMDREVKP